MKLAVVFNRLGPYHVARLSAAAGHGPVVCLEVFGRDRTYAWEAVDHCGPFERVTLLPEEAHSGQSAQVRRAVGAALDRISPHGIAVPGWGSGAALAALHWAAAQSRFVIMMSDSNSWDAHRGWLRESVKRRLLRLAGSALAGGGPQARYLEVLGMPRERVFRGYDVVDNQYFHNGARLARSDSAAIRTRLGLPERFFLVSARFIARKNLVCLVNAYAAYRALSGNDAWELVILGDGPERANVEATIRRHSLRGCVHLAGFRQYPELPQYYGLASAFVHPPLIEQWGLVVNEAMAAACPVIVSNRCGCAEDLVREGVNGFTFEPNSTTQLAALLALVAGDPNRARAMGMESQQIIQRWTPETFAHGLWEAARVARQAPPPRAGLLDRAVIAVLACR
jgi:1,2-diacylglycerol 3-alpha-glucosyltransferase